VLDPNATPLDVEPEGLDEHAEGQENLARMAQLDAFGQSLSKTRAEAISGRLSSGIEDIWTEDEEFYDGIDDLNRSDTRSTWRQKPPGQVATRPTATRSTVFPNITGPFVEAAASRITDMLLPTDDRPWELKPTPIPEMQALAKGEVPQQMQQQLDQQYPDPAQADQAEKDLVEKAKRLVAAATEKAKLAEKRIEDWHVECQWHAQVRQIIEDAARMGTGVLKGPWPTQKKRVTWKDGRMQQVSDIKPGSKWIDPWNIYPDPACGEDIHNGNFVWERDYLTKRQLQMLVGQEGYIKEQIATCLQEGPQTATATYKETPDAVADPTNQKNKFEVWYYHGMAEREDMEAAGCDCGVGDEYIAIPAMVTIVNNHVIRASLNPLDTGEFPYDIFVWRRRIGFWAGIGVARQIRVAQKIVTAATRNLMDNAGVAAGPMLVFRQGSVFPADGVPGIGPRKVYYIDKDDDSIQDATKAIGVVKVDMMVNELLAIVNFGMQLAEQTTGLPMILQGQMGTAPDTVGGMTMLNNNASSTLRRLARLFDDRITEPHLRRYYVWLLQYGEDSEKGDYFIDARGSSALVERDIQNQEIAQMGSIVLDVRFGLDPKKWAQEYLKSRHFDPKRFEYDDEEWKKVVEQMTQGKQDPREAIAQLKAQTDERLKSMDQQFESQENALEREFNLILAELEREMDTFASQNNRDMSFDQVKAKLSEAVIRAKQDDKKLRLQGYLATRKTNPAEQVATPAAEPAGRARPGRAFQT